MGALPTIRAAVDPDAKGGEYYGPAGFMESRGYPVVVQSSAASHNIADQNKLWQMSVELTGVKYDFHQNIAPAEKSTQAAEPVNVNEAYA
jgi:hypothetical protein